jgi:hypothetical protein
VDRREPASAVKVFFATSYVSNVLEWLVTNSYLLLLPFWVPQTVTEKCGKYVVTYACSKDILYVGNSMQYLFLNVVLFMLHNM